jgi:glutathione S-transferase
MEIAIVLEELGLEYNIILLDMFEVKKRPFTVLNPNGRTPGIVDHNNNDLVLWEVRCPLPLSISQY